MSKLFKTKIFKLYSKNGEVETIEFSNHSNLQIKKTLARLVRKYGYTYEPLFLKEK